MRFLSKQIRPPSNLSHRYTSMDEFVNFHIKKITLIGGPLVNPRSGFDIILNDIGTVCPANKSLLPATNLAKHMNFVWFIDVEMAKDVEIIPLGRQRPTYLHSPWWRHQMETFSALLAICAGNSPVIGEFPTQRPVTRSSDVFFDLRLNKRLSKHSWGWWFKTLSRPLWRHCNEFTQWGWVMHIFVSELDHQWFR